MRTPSRNEYIGIVVALVIAVIFFVGINFWSDFFGGGQVATDSTSQDNNNQQMPQITKDVTTQGTGDASVAGDTITVNYVGTARGRNKI